MLLKSNLPKTYGGRMAKKKTAKKLAKKTVSKKKPSKKMVA